MYWWLRLLPRAGTQYDLGICFIVTTISIRIQNSSDLKSIRFGEEAVWSVVLADFRAPCECSAPQSNHQRWCRTLSGYTKKKRGCGERCGDRGRWIKRGQRGIHRFWWRFSQRDEAGIWIKRCNKLQRDEGPAKRVVMWRDDRRNTFSSGWY